MKWGVRKFPQVKRMRGAQICASVPAPGAAFEFAQALAAACAVLQGVARRFGAGCDAPESTQPSPIRSRQEPGAGNRESVDRSDRPKIGLVDAKGGAVSYLQMRRNSDWMQRELKKGSAKAWPLTFLGSHPFDAPSVGRAHRRNRSV